MEALATVAALLAVVVLAIVVVSVARRGGGAISWDLFTKPQALFGQPGGGIANALVGTALLVLLATAMAVPVGVLTAVYLTEFAPRRLALGIQVVLDVLAGLPTIVIGIFVYALLVIGHVQSGFAGALRSGSAAGARWSASSSLRASEGSSPAPCSPSRAPRARRLPSCSRARSSPTPSRRT
jgi:ABC-type phosphate transport system permease subunit